jgi:hypothetical protein
LLCCWAFRCRGDAGSLEKLLRRFRERTGQQHGSDYFESFASLPDTLTTILMRPMDWDI